MEKKFSFNIYSFIIAFVLGLCYVYYVAPKAKNMIKYPTPFNSNKITYKNYDDMCYKYVATEVSCSDKAINQPIN